MDYYTYQEKKDCGTLKQRIRFFVVILITVLFLIGTAYWIFFSEFWKVQSINIQGHERMTEERLLFLVHRAVTTESFILWPNESINIKNEPIIARIGIKKDWWHRSIMLTVFERGSSGVWCNNRNECFWFDKEGILIEKAPRPEGGFVIVFENAQSSTYSLGKIFIEPKFFKVLLIIMNSWIMDDFIFESFIIDREKQEVRAKTTRGLLFYISLRSNPTHAIAALQKLKEEGKISFDNLEYIDLRIENKIYYRQKNKI